MIIAGVAAAVALFTCGAPGGKSMPKTIEVQGHRGARAVRPENTLAAFEYAIAAGADTLELDVVASKDDRVVVTHDPLLNADICLDPNGARIAKDAVRVRDLTFAELQRFDCGSLVNPRFPKQTPQPKAKMPALEEVFELVKSSKHPAAKRVKLNIEMKSVPGRPELAPPPERFAELVAGVIAKSGLRDRCVVQSFDHRTLIALRKRDPAIVISALTSDNLIDFVAVAKSIGAEIVSPDREWITKEAVAALHAAGVRVIPWTANTPEDWKKLVELEVDGIITDDPEGLIRWLEAAGAR